MLIETRNCSCNDLTEIEYIIYNKNKRKVKKVIHINSKYKFDD